MVAYSFQSQFVDPIEAGTKRQTIRAIGKRRHARPGDALQLYTGMRTRNCRKILALDPTCLDVQPICIDVSQRTKTTALAFRAPVFVIDRITINGVELCALKNLEDFARADGFASLEEMADFWGRTHGPGIFVGALITW